MALPIASRMFRASASLWRGGSAAQPLLAIQAGRGGAWLAPRFLSSSQRTSEEGGSSGRQDGSTGATSSENKSDGNKDAGSGEAQNPRPKEKLKQKEGERGGPKGPEPTRYGDWERKGRVTDF